MYLSTGSIYIWNSSQGLINRTTFSINSPSYNISTSFSNLSFGSYEWNCEFEDLAGNIGIINNNNTFLIGPISVILNYPENNYYTNDSEFIFECSSEAHNSMEFSNTTFYLWNSSGDIVENQFIEISGISNSSQFNSTISLEGEYYWNCESHTENESSSGLVNYSLYYDITSPEINLISPQNGQSFNGAQNVGFSFTSTDNFGFSNCSIYLNNELIFTNESSSNSQNSFFSKSLGTGSYLWQVQCYDLAGNFEESELFNFNIQSISSGGGGGGSSSRVTSSQEVVEKSQIKEFNINNKILKESFLLKKDESVKLFINNSIHNLRVESIGLTDVSILIESSPKRFNLSLGEEVKVSLENPLFKELSLKLEEINNDEVTITLRSIFEPIEEEIVFKIQEESENGNKIYQINLGLIIIVILLFIILFIIF